MKRIVLYGTLAAGVLVLALAFWMTPAAANGESPSADVNCLNCHEGLYYNYDTGKYYCVSEAGDRCTNCHGGDPQAVTMEAAHTGRSAHPIVEGDISKCAECHVDDCAARVHKFEELAGLNDVVYAAAPFTPSGEVQALSRPEAEPTGTPFYVFYLGGAVLLIAGFSAGALVVQARCNRRL
ncbi:MAG: hypothetical protein AB1846_03830 [Chloroflexota bacterium]